MLITVGFISLLLVLSVTTAVDAEAGAVLFAVLFAFVWVLLIPSALVWFVVNKGFGFEVAYGWCLLAVLALKEVLPTPTKK